MTDGQRREDVEQRSKENEKKHRGVNPISSICSRQRAWFLGFYVDVEGAKGPGRSALPFSLSRGGAGAAPDIKGQRSRPRQGHEKGAPEGKQRKGTMHGVWWWWRLLCGVLS